MFIYLFLGELINQIMVSGWKKALETLRCGAHAVSVGLNLACDAL